MRQPDWAELIAGVKTLSEEMLALARADDWEAVAEREQRRRDLIENLFAQPLPPAFASRVECCIREVLASDEALTVLGQGKLGALAQQLEKLTLSRKACLAYTDLDG